MQNKLYKVLGWFVLVMLTGVSIYLTTEQGLKDTFFFNYLIILIPLFVYSVVQFLEGLSSWNKSKRFFDNWPVPWEAYFKIESELRTKQPEFPSGGFSNHLTGGALDFHLEILDKQASERELEKQLSQARTEAWKASIELLNKCPSVVRVCDKLSPELEVIGKEFRNIQQSLIKKASMKTEKFNLELAKAGHPLITRGGQEVRKFKYLGGTSPEKMVGIVGGELTTFRNNGFYIKEGDESSFDLFLDKSKEWTPAPMDGERVRIKLPGVETKPLISLSGVNGNLFAIIGTPENEREYFNGNSFRVREYLKSQIVKEEPKKEPELIKECDCKSPFRHSVTLKFTDYDQEVEKFLKEHKDAEQVFIYKGNMFTSKALEEALEKAERFEELQKVLNIEK